MCGCSGHDPGHGALDLEAPAAVVRPLSRRALVLGAAGVLGALTLGARPAAAAAHDLEVIPRAAWGAVEAGAGAVRHEVRRLTVHHSAAALARPSDAPASLRSIQRHHRSQGWSDIAYHLLVGPTGEVYEGRDPAFRGDTATGYDTTGHLLVCLLGNFEHDQPTPAQLEATARIVAWSQVHLGTSTPGVVGHRSLAATACPGRHVVGALDGLRTRAASIAEAPVARIDLGLAEGRRRIDAIASAPSPDAQPVTPAARVVVRPPVDVVPPAPPRPPVRAVRRRRARRVARRGARRR